MSNITFQQYTPHQEKKRVLNINACLHCRKAHTACTSHRPCDRCVRMNVDCLSSSTPTNKKKKELNANENTTNTIDVDSVSQFLFSDTPTAQHFNININNNNNTTFNSSSFVPTTNNVENQFNFIQPTSFLPIENFPVYDAPSPSLSSPSSFSLPSPSVLSSSSSSPMQFVPEDCCGDAEDNYIDNHVLTQNNNATIQFSTYINASGSDNIVTQNNNNMSNDPRIDELIAQNKRMEMKLSSLSRQVDYLQTKMDPNIVNSTSSMLPATATWKLPSCEMLECNKTFMDLLGFSDNDSEMKLITFFQLGACTKAIGKIQKRIETAINSGVSLKEPPHTKTMAIPIFRKNRDVIVMNLTAIVYLDCPVPVLTTVLRYTN